MAYKKTITIAIVDLAAIKAATPEAKFYVAGYDDMGHEHFNCLTMSREDAIAEAQTAERDLTSRNISVIKAY